MSDAPIFHAPPLKRAARLLDLAALSERVYAAKGFAASDFPEVKPGLVVVKPIRPPKMVGGVEVPETAWNLPGQTCWMHQVVAVSDTPPDGCIPLVPGDVVICMLAFLDPLDTNGNLCDILHDKIVDKIGHAPLE